MAFLPGNLLGGIWEQRRPVQQPHSIWSGSTLFYSMNSYAKCITSKSENINQEPIKLDMDSSQ